jgi:MFS family permease
LVQISQLTIMRHAMPDHLRGRALALLGGNIRLARVFAPFLGGLLVQAAGYRSVLWCYAGLLVSGCALFVRLGPHRQVAATPPREAVLAAVRRLVRENGRLLIPAGGTLLMLAVLRTSRNMLLPLWGYKMALAPATIGMVVSAGAAVDTFLFPLSGIVSDRNGRKWSLACNMGIMALGLLTLATFGSTLTGFVAAAVVSGIGNGLGAGINMTVGSDLAPKGRDTGPFLGLWRAITDTGGMLGPLAVGGIAQALALGPAAIVIGLGGLGGVALMGRFMPETKGFRR